MEDIDKPEEKIAIYNGSFDPPTNGHLDIIERGLRLFDKIVVCIMYNPNKKYFFTVEERIDMLKEILKEHPNVEVEAYHGLAVDFAKMRKAHAILRGLRATSDFEYEFQMSLMNRRLNRDIQTVFLMSGFRWIFTSSSIIKEAASFGGDVESMVPIIVNQRLKEKYENGKKNE
ncbi:MAG: pantetheine-phosphate adenylyltransferase [Proteobacteria bacterium]|nr:pantetheine-phosphate adenylyltransferase [Pseudomonadota bacterium]